MTLQRRSYRVETSDYDGKRVEVVILVEGQQVARLGARAPGMVACLVRPGEEGFSLELVEDGEQRHVDHLSPGEVAHDAALQPWQREALGL